MAEKKKQHYVPQFYLRAFAVASSDNQIGLYHLPTGKYVSGAPIKTQAYDDNFYGSVPIEDSLNVIEGRASAVIRKIVDREVMPERLSQDHYALAVFVLFQHCRTAHAAEAFEELIDRSMKQVASHEPALREHLDEVSVHVEDAPRQMLRMAAELHPLMFDLRFKLLRNRTCRPFITSDHPVAFYNQFMEHRNPHAGNTGVACKGLQILLPLSPRHTLILFDSDVYKVGGRKLRSMKVDVAADDDVFALNVLQAANADEHVYFGNDMPPSAIKRIVTRAEPFRRPEKAHVQEHKGQMPDGSQHDIIHSQKVDVRMGLKLRCVKILESAKAYDLGNVVVHVRNREICELHEQFLSEVEAGNYKLHEFPRFLRDRQGKSQPGGLV